MTPTPFQVRLHYDAVQLLGARKIPFTSGTVERPHEIALTVTFQETTLFIFKDGADFVTPVDRTEFEKRDYQNFESLRAACLEFLAGLLR
jgi:hypothetical protein